MRRLGNWGAPLLVGVIMLLLAVVWWGDRRDSMLIPPNEEVRAAGHLRLLAKLGRDDRREQLGELLEREKVAPVASFFRPLWPQQIVAQQPAERATTPILPTPDYPGNKWEALQLMRYGRADEVSEHVAGGKLAATVSSNTTTRFSPCLLTIKYGRRSSAKTIQRTLVERLSLQSHKTGLVVYGGGQGLLVSISGYLPDSSDPPGYGEDFAAVYLAEAPEWKPELLVGSEQLGGFSYMAGVTVDGSSVFIMDLQDGSRRIWEVDTASHNMHLVTRDPSLRMSAVIPSPDGTFLAGGAAMQTIGSYAARPIQLVDCRSGSVRTLTWRDHGSYSDTALAWSADVPGRLYFLDLFWNLWQLDIDLSQEPSASALP